LLQAVHRRNDLLRDLQRVATRKLQDPDTDGVGAVVPDAPGVVFGTEFDAADIAHANVAAVGRGPQNDVTKAGRIVQPAVRANGVFVGLMTVGRRSADRSGRNLNVLIAQ